MADDSAALSVENLRYKCHSPVAVLTLNQPDTLNALTVTLVADLLAAIRRAESDDDVRAVVLTGSGRSFCACQNLRDRCPDGSDVEEAVMRTYYLAFAARQAR